MLVGLGLGLTACSEKSTPPGPPTTAPARSARPSTPLASTTPSSIPPATSASTTPGTVGAATIIINATRLVPTTLTVTAGATVTVKNTSGTTRTIAATGAHAGAFTTGPIPAGGTATFHAPHAAGTYDFDCPMHPSMKGVLVVR
jgi:plastocyanin